MKLLELGILAIIPFDDIFTVNGVPVLNGMFGVKKPKAAPIETADGLLDVLRLIMNMIPSNHWQRMIIGDLAELPVSLTWQQLVLLEGEALLWTSSDRRCFFYVFRLVKEWLPYFAFSRPVRGELIGQEPGTWVYVLRWLWLWAGCPPLGFANTYIAT